MEPRPAGNSASASSRSQMLGYDNLNRLTRVIGGTTDTYAYSPTANQISTVTTGSNVRSFSYLASGQVSQDVGGWPCIHPLFINR